MRRIVLFASLLALLLGLGLPARAGATGGILPPMRLITSARFELAILENGRIVAVGQGFKESRNRFYLTLQRFDPDTTSEWVVYDGAAYTRQNGEQAWGPGSVALARRYVPTADLLLLFDGPLTALGTTMINGVAAEHYQIWGDGLTEDPREPGFVKIDFFLGPQDRYLYQFQFDRTVANADGGTRQVAATMRFYDHGDPSLKVTPP